MFNSEVLFELSWQGPYQLFNNTISTIDIHFENFRDAIFASIDTNHPTILKQRLNVSVIKKSNMFNEIDHCNSIKCPLEIAQTIQLSARILQLYKNKSFMIHASDSSFYCQELSKIENFEIFIESKPTFKPGKTYKILMTNNDNNLIAKIIKVKRFFHDQETIRIDKEDNLNQIIEPKNNQNFSDSNSLFSTISGFNKIIETSLKDNLNLDKFNKEELQEKFKRAKKDLNEANLILDEAFSSGKFILAALEYKQEISNQVIKLQRAIAQK